MAAKTNKKSAVKKSVRSTKAPSPKKATVVKKAVKVVKKADAPKKKATKKVAKTAAAPKKSNVVKKTAPAARKTPKIKVAAPPKKKATPTVAAKKKVPVAQKKKTVAVKKASPAKKSSAGAANVKKTIPARPEVRPAPTHPQLRRKIKEEQPLTEKELKKYHQALLDLRDKVVDDISFLSGDNLNRSQREASGDLSAYSLHMADQGTDNYDREFALNLVSSEQNVLYEIDEAIRRINAGAYGVCELSGVQIERARLNALPYARNSVAAQSELEKGRTRHRPFEFDAPPGR